MQDGPLQHLIKTLSGLPGLGNRSARRIALHMLAHKNQTMLPLADLLKRTAEEIRTCSICGNLDMPDPCNICQDARRSKTQICVVAQVSDLWAIERTSAYKGQYHVLGGLLSALDGIGPDQLNLTGLIARTADPDITEVILALSATVDGQSTAHYIADHINRPQLEVTHLAHGVPVGGELDYLDDGTITTALRSRKKST
ncbi:MAG: recombination protein RecR [Rhodospirillales bacterium]|nr:recombination protein RecR [Alphaproteobacteria bacterium]MCB9981948.1 recombination protein RecR [Rhodospirillales bacterium]